MNQPVDHPAWDPATPEDLAILREQLDRVPRGVVGIGARRSDGRPTVVVTAPRLEDGTPFPTTFYLTDPDAIYACSVLEAEKVMEDLNRWLAEDPRAMAAHARAHEDYIARRRSLGEVPQIDGISAGGMPNRVKCLHALLAHSLVAGPGVNVVGDRALEIIVERGLWTLEAAGR
ncbi:DUF501 domain-containing protein [Schaalia sp. 19OD2882]|uniref:DUF501 domain-containing protein n=1 Tax=Schaalia sp. 19OD2882 TaxID=2794089 RepID=UPI001C1F0A45|nr:DUF501 domain-containing protein [Schaalia sp. 19OD2882]QWW20188.1 DUF501 domain-containing protein [Schaalia sp. 19OD2882]